MAFVSRPVFGLRSISAGCSGDSTPWPLSTGSFSLGVPHELMAAEIGRFKGYRGVRQLRVLVPLGDGRSESPGESVLRLHWYDAGLPSLTCSTGSTRTTGSPSIASISPTRSRAMPPSTTARSSTPPTRINSTTWPGASGSLTTGRGPSTRSRRKRSTTRHADPIPQLQAGFRCGAPARSASGLRGAAGDRSVERETRHRIDRSAGSEGHPLTGRRISERNCRRRN